MERRGSMETLKSNNFGNKTLVEDCQKIRINDTLKSIKVKFKDLLLRSELEAAGINIDLTTSKTLYDGIRFWFKCPICEARVGVVYQHPLDGSVGCRKCLNLDYRQRRYKGMLEETYVV